MEDQSKAVCCRVQVASLAKYKRNSSAISGFFFLFFPCNICGYKSYMNIQVKGEVKRQWSLSKFVLTNRLLIDDTFYSNCWIVGT